MSARPASDAVLDIRGLNVAIGGLSPVRGVDLHVNRRETLCLVGESGCGKSLTSLAIMDLLPRRARRSAERLTLAGVDLMRLPPAQMRALRGERMAMIFQEPMTSLNPVYSVGEQLVEGFIAHRGGSRAVARERALMLLAKVGIAAGAERMRQYPHQMSGGLRQRIMIAMSLMCSPELLIADEPTTALDVTVQLEILRLLKSLQVELDLGILFITHDLGVVAHIADRVAVMYAGKIVELAPVEELFDNPRHPYTRALLDCVPGQGRHRGERLGVIRGRVPTAIGADPGCAFRNRCDHAFADCATAAERLEAIFEATGSRCLLTASASPAIDGIGGDSWSARP